MIEKLTLAAALLGLVLPWSGPKDRDTKATRIRDGWDFGTMPENERYADWS